MKQMYGYIRVSTVKQGEGVSLEAQKDAIQAYADRNAFVISRWFEEKETAAKSGRKIFSQMVRDLKAHRADGLIIHKIDRSARNLRDWATIGELSDLGVDVYFATESLDFRSRGGRLTADIQAVIAADYIRNLREETIKGIRGRLKQGLYPFKAPIGYLDNGGGKPKTLDPIRAPLVRKAFELYASREYSFNTLLHELNVKGLRNVSGNPISMCCLENMLANPFYCGLIEIKRTREIFQGVHEPLIRVELYKRIQTIKSNRCGKKVTRHNHVYRGLFHCGHCKGSMIPELQKGRVYYRCQAQLCPTTTVREDGIEAAVQAALQLVDLTEDAIDRVVTGLEAFIGRDDKQAILRGYDAQIAQLEDRQERLTDAFIDRLIDEETYTTRKRKLTLEHADTLERRADEAKKHATPDDARRFLELAKTLTESYRNANSNEKRRIVNSAFSNRTVVGKELYLEPSEWLQAAQQAPSVLCGAPERCTSRTFLDLMRSMEDHEKRDVIENLPPPDRYGFKCRDQLR